MRPERDGASEQALDDNALGPLLSVARPQPAPVQSSSTVVPLVPATPVLIASKLSIPWPARQTMTRPKLEEVLQAGADHALTVLVAPAGFGKTMLTARWLTHWAGHTAGWVSLEPADNNVTLFWSYVRAALMNCSVAVPQVPSRRGP